MRIDSKSKANYALILWNNKIKPEKMSKNNLYITALEFAETKLNSDEGMSYFSLKNHLESKGYTFDLTTDPDLSHFRLLYKAITGVSTAPAKEGGGGDFPYNMSIDAYFNLIEYKELKEAREASKIAMKRSTIAIGISIASMFISSAISIYQMNTPTELSSMSVSELKQLKYNDNQIKKELISIGINQSAIVNELQTINKTIKNANKSFNQNSVKKAPSG